MANSETQVAATKRNRWLSLAWIVGVAALIITCLVLQQTALLYVLSTVSVTILLIVVAQADLIGDNKSA